jgi:hypothetical protein
MGSNIHKQRYFSGSSTDIMEHDGEQKEEFIINMS